MHFDLMVGGAKRRLTLNENAVIDLYELTGDDLFALGQRLAAPGASPAEKMRAMRLLAWTCLSQSQKFAGKPETVSKVGEWLSADQGIRLEVMRACGSLIEHYLRQMSGPPEFEGQLAPFVPTPENVVEVMARFVKPGDTVTDLGAGDGRLLDAAREAGAATVFGYEREVNRYDKLENKYRHDEMVKVFNTDIRDADISGSDVVFLYLLGTSNAELKNKLLSEMKPGALVVSHDFAMPEWEPNEEVRVTCPDREHVVYVWTIPAGPSA
jgi:hypothetical protein